MARGKYKASAERRIEALQIEDLKRQVEELTKENTQLKLQAEQDHSHHAFQIAQMYEYLSKGTSPKVEAVEADNAQLREELIRLKKALRGVTD